MKTFPATRPLVRLLPVHFAKLAGIFLSRGAALSRRWFETEAARRVLPGLALHVDVGPDDWFGAALGFMLGMTATTGGYAIPIGGAQSIADAMIPHSLLTAFLHIVCLFDACLFACFAPCLLLFLVAVKM